MSTPKGQAKTDSLTEDLRSQVKSEIDGAELPAAKKFAIEQKYGLHEPFLTPSEKRTIELETASEAYIGH